LSKPGNDNAVEPSANVVSAADASSSLKAFFYTYKGRKWIIDTGATHHITSTLDNLDNAKVSPAHAANKVHLPNGKVAIVSHVGNTCVLDNQPVSNVLFLPDFNFNLLSCLC